MATRWYPIGEADDTFFDIAPLYHHRSVELPYTAEETWAALTGDGASGWTKGMKRLTWTSSRPYGVGTTREIELGGGFILRERFFRWDEGRRKTFTAVEGTRNIFRHLVEDYLVEPTADGSRFSLRWAAELNRPWAYLRGPLDRFMFVPTYDSHLDGLPGYLAAHR